MVIIQNELQGRALFLLANLAVLVGQKVVFTSPNVQDKEKLHKKVDFHHLEGCNPIAFIGEPN